MASTLSFVVPTKNCVARLEKVISPWLGVAKEIIIVDQMSTDGTAELAKKLGCTVIQNEPPRGNFNINRKIGMERAQGEWILYLDSDEIPTPELLEELKGFLSNQEAQKDIEGVRIPNLFYFLGKPLRYGIYSKTGAELRMFRQGKWHYPAEKGIHYGVSVKGRWITFKNPYRHFNVNALSEWFLKTNQYTEHDSATALKEGRPILTYKAFWKAFRFFVRHYIIKLGFLDGFRGLIAVFYFMLYHLTYEIKVWEFKQRESWVEGKDWLAPIEQPRR